MWFEHYKDKKWLCSECDPQIGEWHGRFEKMPAEGMYFDENHMIYGADEVDEKTLELTYNRSFKMVGRIVNGEYVRVAQLDRATVS